MFQWLTMFVALLVAIPVTLAEETALPSSESYYPLQVGASWQFDMQVQGKQLKVTNRVAKLERIDDLPLFRVETTINGQTSATEHLGQTEQGLIRYRINGIEMTPPLSLLKNPVTLGESWKTKIKMGGQTLDIACVVADKKEKISVPAGEYLAIKLTVDTDVEGVQVLSDQWFAADIGIVKQHLNIGGQIADLELREYQPTPR